MVKERTKAHAARPMRVLRQSCPDCTGVLHVDEEGSPQLERCLWSAAVLLEQMEDAYPTALQGDATNAGRSERSPTPYHGSETTMPGDSRDDREHPCCLGGRIILRFFIRRAAARSIATGLSGRCAPPGRGPKPEPQDGGRAVQDRDISGIRQRAAPPGWFVGAGSHEPLLGPFPSRIDNRHGGDH
jgi:hypothetical protein